MAGEAVGVEMVRHDLLPGAHAAALKEFLPRGRHRRNGERLQLRRERGIRGTARPQRLDHVELQRRRTPALDEQGGLLREHRIGGGMGGERELGKHVLLLRQAPVGQRRGRIRGEFFRPLRQQQFQRGHVQRRR